MKKLVLAVLACASLGLLFACADSDGGESKGEAVPITGEVNIYSSRHYDTDLALYEDFTRATGIKVNRIEADADALIEKGRRTMDEAERMLVWRQLEQVIAADQPYTFVRVSPWLRFVSRDYGNVNTYRTGLQPEEFFRVALPAPGSE
jgi:ABC-type transport system substrate-binding protein